MKTCTGYISSVLVGTLLFNVALIGCGPDNGKRRERIRTDQGVKSKQGAVKPAQAATTDPTKQPPAATADPSRQPQTGGTADPTPQPQIAAQAEVPQGNPPGGESPPGDKNLPPPTTGNPGAVLPTPAENQTKTDEINKILAELQLSEPTSIQNIPEGQFVLSQIYGKISYQDSPFYQALSISDLGCQDASCSKAKITQKRFLSNMAAHGSPNPLTSELKIPFIIKKASSGLITFEKDLGLKFIINNQESGKLEPTSSLEGNGSANPGGVLATTLNNAGDRTAPPSVALDASTYKVGSGPDSGAEITFTVAQVEERSEIRVFVDLPNKGKTASNFVLIYQIPAPSK